MRHRYGYLDPALIQAILAGLDLLRLFNQLVLASGGDVDEAMEWMRYLQQQGYLDESIDLDAFFAALEEQKLIRGDGEGGMALTAGGERRIRRSAFEEIFGSLRKAGPGYHPVRSAGDGVERLPETRPYRFGDDDPPPRLAALAAERHAAHPRRPRPRRGGPRGPRDRAPDLVRHGRRHRHQPLDDPLRRGPHHAGQAGGPGAHRADHQQVPEGPPRGDPLRRPRRAGGPRRHPLHRGRAVPHQHPRRPAAWHGACWRARSSPTSRSS